MCDDGGAHRDRAESPRWIDRLCDPKPPLTSGRSADHDAGSDLFDLACLAVFRFSGRLFSLLVYLVLDLSGRLFFLVFDFFSVPVLLIQGDSCTSNPIP